MLGGERSLVLASAATCGGIVIASMNLPSFLFAVIVWPSTLFLFRLMAKADPHMSAVWRKANIYRGYIPPVPTIHRKDQK